jgi:hypothetical protein
MLLSAGFAPVYAERSLDDPAMAAARQAVELVLKGHEPFPALAIDRHWTLLAANRALAPLLANIGNKALLEPPLNVLRLSLHPEGLAPQIANLMQWRSHLLERLRRQIAVSGDGGLSGLLQELSAYPSGEGEMEEETEENGVFVPLRLRVAGTVLSFLSTTTLFGTPRDITLSELAIEAFFPADAATAKALRS